MTKTLSVAYYSHKIETTNKKTLIREWKSAPLTIREYDFLVAIRDGLSYKELSEKFRLSESRIGKWKRELFVKMHMYDVRK